MAVNSAPKHFLPRPAPASWARFSAAAPRRPFPPGSSAAARRRRLAHPWCVTKAVRNRRRCRGDARPHGWGALPGRIAPLPSRFGPVPVGPCRSCFGAGGPALTSSAWVFSLGPGPAHARMGTLVNTGPQWAPAPVTPVGPLSASLPAPGQHGAGDVSGAGAGPRRLSRVRRGRARQDCEPRGADVAHSHHKPDS